MSGSGLLPFERQVLRLPHVFEAVMPGIKDSTMATSPSPSILVVDRCPFVLAGVTDCLASAFGNVPECCTSLDEAEVILAIRAIDILILGSNLEQRDAFALCRSSASERRDTKVVMMVSATDDVNVETDAASVGASACLRQGASCDDLCAAIRAASRGYRLFSIDTLHAAARVDTLTSRERDILRLLAGELTYTEIAREIEIALPTVRNHAQHILEKLDVHDHNGAARRAQRLGLDAPNQ